MINTLKIFNELSQTMDTSAARKIAEVIGMVYEELQNTVTKVEFNELKEIVKDLAEAQKRTETRVEELVEAQKRTETRVEELAEAQKRTEIAVKALAVTVKNIQRELGGISNTIGYELEDRFYPVFPQVLKEDFGVDISGEIKRRFIVYPSGKDDEINIYGEGMLEGQEVYIIGESKAQLGKNDVKDFNKLLKRVKDHLGKKIIPLLLCYSLHPVVEKFIKEEYPEIKVYRSYELSGKVKG
jgi:hypothetical protein